MKARTGRNQNGEVSNRCLENTGARHFLIVEFDTGATDEHAAVLFHLAQRAPLALVVHSGSKSLHGWFYCAGVAEEKVLRFFRYAVSLGADRATWTRCQLVRCRWDKGRWQQTDCLFFQPEGDPMMAVPLADTWDGVIAPEVNLAENSVALPDAVPLMTLADAYPDGSKTLLGSRFLS